MANFSTTVRELPMTLQYPDSSIGDIKFVSHNAIPNGWMECDGSPLSRTTFIELFNKIGTTFGVGDGSTTFNLPDLRGRVPVARGQGASLTNRNLGDKGGEEAHKLTIAEMPNHTHTVPLKGWNSHAGSSGADTPQTGGTISVDYTGGDGAHNNMQPFFALIAIIKVKNIAGYDPYVYRGNALTLGGIPSSGFLLSTQGVNFKNAVINGNFQFWQRGTSFNNTAFTADRWALNQNGSTSVTSRQAFTLGQGVIPNEPSYFLRTVITSVANAVNYAQLSHHVESVRTLAGKTVTLSFWAKADANKPIAIDFQQFFGSGGSPSATVFGISPQQVMLTTSWAKYSISITVPSITGKTLGSNNNDYLGFNFWLDAGTNYASRTANLGQQSGTFDFAQVQLEEGSASTNYEVRPMQTELALCQRYFEKSYSPDIAPGTASVPTMYCGVISTNYLQGTKFIVPKRGVPTMTIYSFNGTIGKTSDINGTDAGGTIAAQYPTLTHLTQIFGTFTANSNMYQYHWTADAEL